MCTLFSAKREGSRAPSKRGVKMTSTNCIIPSIFGFRLLKCLPLLQQRSQSARSCLRSAEASLSASPASCTAPCHMQPCRPVILKCHKSSEAVFIRTVLRCSVGIQRIASLTAAPFLLLICLHHRDPTLKQSCNLFEDFCHFSSLCVWLPYVPKSSLKASRYVVVRTAHKHHRAKLAPQWRSLPWHASSY